MLIFFSCSKSDTGIQQGSAEAKFITHKILKGNHNSESNKMMFFNDIILQFSAVFDSTAIYHTALPENQQDINKLYGFSDCSSAHHSNSARFGWRWNGASIDVLAYTYINGIRSHKLIGTAEIGKANQYKLMVRNNKYFFQFNHQLIAMDRGCETGKAKGYVLYPYFGGDETAPHNINLLIKTE